MELANLPPERLFRLAEYLRTRAVRCLRIDPHQALPYADTIIHIGETLAEPRIIALGVLVRADVLRNLHQDEEAWALYHEAGERYIQVNDEIGWARTRIGRLALCVEMNEVEAGLQDAEAARAIFRAHHQTEILTRLETNAAVIHNQLAQYPAAIETCREVMRLMEATGQIDPNTVTIISYITGRAHHSLGNLQEATHHYEQARESMLTRGEKHGIALVDLDRINLAQAQGRNKEALRLIHDTIDTLARDPALAGGKEIMHIIEGYLFLNRFQDARALALSIIRRHAPEEQTYSLALSLIQLAVADSALGNFDQVFPALERAELIFSHLKMPDWLGMVYLYQGQAALRQDNLEMAHRVAEQAVQQFRLSQQRINHLMALLLLARIDIAYGKPEAALQTAWDVRQAARQFDLPQINYEAHLLLGKIAEQMKRPFWAIRCYQIATRIMEGIQRSLTLTMRADYLADKQEAVQALVRLNLELGQTEAAFAALERAKAQVWLNYLSQSHHLRWLPDSPDTYPLIEELKRLREKHHWYYRAAFDQVFREQQHIMLSPSDAASEAAIRERRLRAVTEQLYLHTSVEDLAATSVIPAAAIQQALPEEAALVAYYSDSSRLWVFVLDAQRVTVYPLPEPVAAVEKLLEKWQSNIDRALRVTPGSKDEQLLSGYALSLAQRLYDALARPFASLLRQRLIVVPYGALHYLPFQLLHDGNRYLIEQTEVVVLPAASLLTHRPPRQPRQALAIAYSWDGRLKNTLPEVQRVVERFGGRLLTEAEAAQAVLKAPPCQVLHIAAHGQHRMDQPDFSYIQLADGPLYTDDLFQHDLRYELVTLSACETGRSHVTPGDELVGLGRGFLFAGAGALVASLWRVDETLTVNLMDEFYHRLCSGASKAAALRDAQLALMRAYPGLHPAFWGAFELIGSADPLTPIDG